MRIGILTHPLTFNYGGILQCYALSKYLEKCGHTTIIIRREQNTSILKRLVRSTLKALHIKPYFNDWDNLRIRNISSFIRNNFNRTNAIYSDKNAKKICYKYDLGAVIVGSDQVWRRDFAMHYGYNYFLDFVPNNVVKLSYAASFGLSDWQYNSIQTDILKNLLSSFSGVSVREMEAVKLCEDYLGIDAGLKMDPTLLLTSSDYDKVASFKCAKEPYVFFYWLGDINLIKEDVSNYQCQGYSTVIISLRETAPLPKVEDWLSYIKYADRIVTDSFHGCVFSIIYHKSVDIRYHKSYGRIRSLLDLLKVDENRMNNMDEQRYKSVDDIIRVCQQDSATFLDEALQCHENILCGDKSTNKC